MTLPENSFSHFTSNSAPNPVRDATTFSNPVVASLSAGDPWVIWHAGFYYFTYTTGVGGLWVWRSKTLTGLEQAQRVLVWKAPDSGPRSRQIWAPELHYLRGRWYLYFTASDGIDANQRHYVLEATTDDPLGPWEDKGENESRVDPAFEHYAIDGSLLELPDGRLFFMYASQGKHQGLNIASMHDPMRVSGAGVTFVRGTHEWERGWNDATGAWAKGKDYWIEAPQMLLHEDRVFVVYSAGHTFAEYRLGLLELTGQNPIDPASWVKYPEPLFEPYDGEAGKVVVPGHCCFTRSPDGTEDWIMYHGKDDPTDEKRTARIQKFTWNAEGIPDFGHPIPSGVPQTRPSGEVPG